MVNFTILAGGYDVFIASYLFNSDAGTLNVTGRFPSGANPSWITPGIGNRSIFYATNENAVGGLQSFTVTPDGVVSSAVNTIGSGGDSPAFAAALSSGQVAVMNYGSGDGRIVPLTQDGLGFEDSAVSAGLIKFPIPTAPTSENVSHPHMALEVGSEVFVPDLGGDIIWRLTQNIATGNWSITGSIPQPPSSGPRHIAVSCDRLFTLHELASTLTVQAIPAFPNGTSEIIDMVSIIPEETPAGASYAAAEILIPKPTKEFTIPYIYASNRNVGTQDPSGKGDSIAIFELVDIGTPYEKLKLINQVFTGLDQIRGMEIGLEENGGDEFLIAAGVAGSAGTVVYRRVDGGRNLEEVARNLDIPTWTSFIWL
ncbi:hypothetical protein K435DRAFT_660635 [Dendrothele bispora CBS 962.96]|uniref:Isomerase YbhE n=1 Tax=Dendrothele bispora (strain CBS 962.96) TaxID=1314807 RepID=A0A4S8M927_DENBC|nr:hypothetical protein K435DRAFT_660635 [Dendrothele bispora CBS 962.96]